MPSFNLKNNKQKETTESSYEKADRELLQHVEQLQMKALRLSAYEWDLAARYFEHAIDIARLLIQKSNALRQSAYDIHQACRKHYLDCQWQYHGRFADEDVQLTIIQGYQALIAENHQPAKKTLQEILKDKALSQAIQQDSQQINTQYTSFEELTEQADSIYHQYWRR